VGGHYVGLRTFSRLNLHVTSVFYRNPQPHAQVVDEALARVKGWNLTLSGQIPRQTKLCRVVITLSGNCQAIDGSLVPTINL
jgi:hypothetical protein